MVGREKIQNTLEHSSYFNSSDNNNLNNSNNNNSNNNNIDPTINDDDMDNGNELTNKSVNENNNENFDLSNTLQSSNHIETQLQNQIQSQLQNHLQNEINETFEKHQNDDSIDDDTDTFKINENTNNNVNNNNDNNNNKINDNDKDNNNNNIDNDKSSNNKDNNNPSDLNVNNILDSTNIDDELRNLGHLDINNIAKSAVDAAEAAAATAAAVSFVHTGNDIDNNDKDDDNNNVNNIDNNNDKNDNDNNDDIKDNIKNDSNNVNDLDTIDHMIDNSNMHQNADNTNTNKVDNVGIVNIDGIDDIDVNMVNRVTQDITRKRKLSDIKDSQYSTLLKNLKFWLPINTNENEQLKTTIEILGGEIVDKNGPHVLPLVPSKESAKPDLIEQYLYNFIYDTYEKKSKIDINKYRVIKSGNQTFKINIGEFPIMDKSVDGTSNDEDNNNNNNTNNNNNNDKIKKNEAKEEDLKEKNKVKDEDKKLNDKNENSIDNSKVNSEVKSKTSNKKKSSKPVDPTKPKKKSNKFTKAEDDFILDLVRRNPHLRSTHTFFASIAQLKPLSEHTGNSIRYRYRKVLSSKLDYVYKIDPETCKPVIDPETNEPVKIKEIPSLIKSQYTAEEDLTLCKHILAYKSGEMVIESKRKYEVTQIPESVFQELYKINPRHSIMSWRDRYRKFAAKYGLRKYIAYYERCLERDVEPQPMKNMSSRKDRKDYKVDTFGYESDQKSVKRPKQNEEQSTDDSIKQDSNENKETLANKPENTNSNTELVELNKNTETPKDDTNDDAFVDPNLAAAKGALEALANLSAKQIKVVENGDDNTTNQNINDKVESIENIDKNNSENKDILVDDEIKHIDEVSKKIAQTVNSSSAANDGANLFVDATEDEMKQYDIALHNAELEESNTSTEKKDSENIDVSVNEQIPVDEDDNDVELVDIKADDGLMDFRQLIDIDPEPLKHRDDIDLSTMISNIRECFRNFGDGNTPYELFKDISDQTGISMLWLNYWFDCSCGMLGTFIQAIINYLKTGELVMNNVSGFWTEKDDELLKVDPDNKDLLELHGKDSVTKRKAVLFRYV